MTHHDAGATFDARALRHDLERRFRTAERTTSIGGREVTLLSPANADDLISEDDYVMDERLPYWARLWPSGEALARELASEPPRPGTRVLELGCGLGLVSTAAVMAGAKVTATDYYDDALLFAKLNVLDATGRAIETRMVNWVEMPADLGRFDIVLASDVLYEHRYASLVANAIATTLVRGGEAIVADPGRIALQGFLDECAERGLVASGDPRPYAEGEIRQTVTLWRVTWKTD